jgi:hypothetical protein
MKRLLGILGAIAFFAAVLIAGGIGKVGGRAAADAIMQPSKREIVAYAIEQTKSKLPMMADAETRLDSASSGPDGETLIYSYTLINWTADQLSAADMQRMKETVINQTCAREKETLLNRDIALGYRYESSDGVQVQEFQISPGKCIYDPFAKQYGLAP